MPLVNSLPLIKMARKHEKAIPAFNVHNLETIQAVIEGAAELKSPVIIQTTPGTVKHAGITYIGQIVKQAADNHQIPIALHMDHCHSYDMIVACLRNHYTSVMIDGSNLDFDKNVTLTKKVVELAHAIDVQVEAELGCIGGVEDDLVVDQGLYTDPKEAMDFVRATGVDTLAVAIGTAHGLYLGQPKLDFERILKISNDISQPLVLHGASGLSEKDIKRAIKCGMAKINIATELKLPMAAAIKEQLVDLGQTDPRKYMGAARDAVKTVVQEKIRICGTIGFADYFNGGTNE